MIECITLILIVVLSGALVAYVSIWLMFLKPLVTIFTCEALTIDILFWNVLKILLSYHTGYILVFVVALIVAFIIDLLTNLLT